MEFQVNLNPMFRVGELKFGSAIFHAEKSSCVLTLRLLASVWGCQVPFFTQMLNKIFSCAIWVWPFTDNLLVY
jgi:hypothetical protein